MEHESSVTWRTATDSMSNGNCVEVADGILVRDSQDRSGHWLTVTPDAWRAFTEALKGGAA